MSLHLTGILLYTRNKTDYITHNYSSQTKVSATIFAPSRVYFYVPVNKKGRIKVQCSTLQPRGYTFIYPQTKRVTQNLGSFPTPSRVYFYTPATIRVHHTQLLHTTTWVYFYTPTNTEGYTKLRNFPHTLAGILLYTRRQGLTQHLEKSHTLAGILLYTRRQRGLHKTSDHSPHPHGYTFIYPPHHRTYVVAPRYVIPRERKRPWESTIVER